MRGENQGGRIRDEREGEASGLVIDEEKKEIVETGRKKMRI